MVELKFRDPEWLNKILDKSKVVEGRLDKKNKWSKFKKDFDDGKVSHLLMQYLEGDEVVKMWRVAVTGINMYASFEEMLNKEGLDRVLPGKKTIQEGVKVYHGIDGFEKGEKEGMGICGIRIGQIEEI
jgi:ASC-1-like (ASCH) protein